LNHLQGLPYEVTYWLHRNDEVDYVVRAGDKIWAIEVKSGRPGRKRGMAAFVGLHPNARMLVIGTGGMALEEFFSVDPKEFFNT